ncbi:tetratricopeptide repeat-containing sulfotransferase family protein [Biformimicrobium ophioploci]|uniref:Tetratricopeptide repeat-containing sulfotransferase family protein n=1 Tax=Biformimicrobium ophioploci TaxID=3036711 RepID=A0ABQ6LVN4_9GAMM|nr:tetratricopeptide repeat-containing sulfotransferase family protein [Microbulbifer sp. NKW57]GMG86140.1 tetratricopeptide repeat-containing sulfotransferase family protein [Microbulbifer sp. NKW57]
MSATQTGSLVEAIKQAYLLLNQQRPDLARAQATEILDSVPGEVNAQLVIAICQRLQGDVSGAHSALTQLLEHAKDFASAWHELGLCEARLGDHGAAIKALERAVALQPGLSESWLALAEYYTAREQHDRAANARTQHLRQSVAGGDLASAFALFEKGRIAQAEAACRDYLYQHPTDVNAIRLLAEIGSRAGALADVENLLARCLELAPDFDFARLQYAGILNRREKGEAALAEVEKLEQAPRPIPAVQVLKAAVLAKLGRYPEAIEVYDHMLTEQPRQPALLVSRGHAQKTIGEQEAAIGSYRAAIDCEPQNGEAWWSLANLKTYRFGTDELAQMRTQLQEADLTEEQRVQLLFALAKGEEDAGDYAQSFAHYEQGNALKAVQEGYSAEETSRYTDRLIQTCTAELFAAQGEGGCEDPAPVFIVGLPRAGSTLLEQILASHSQVDGTKELPDILALVRRLSGQRKRDDESRYPAVLADLNAEERIALGEEYLARTRVQRGNAPHFIDKMPNNFAHIGLIKLILPNAKIIDARRHPMACCFSGFKQLFAVGQSFTYGLENIGRYYRDYLRLMDHWHAALPGKVLTVQYEEVVADLEPQVRRILDFCGLPFEPACLDFHKTRRSVRTASSEQVRRPINRDGLAAWEPYSPYLDDLRAALGETLQRFS